MTTTDKTWTTTDKTCVVCSKNIDRHAYWHGTSKGPTCSAKCRDKARKA